MQKLSNFTNARHGWGMGRHMDNTPAAPPPQIKRVVAPVPQLSPAEAMVNLAFNVPFASTLNGPDADEVLHASPGAFQRWTHPEGTDENTPAHRLPVHVRNVENLRHLCKSLSEASGGRLEAQVTSSEPKPIPTSQRLPHKGLVTNVCVSGEGELVHKMRAKILSETPIVLKCAVVDIDSRFVVDSSLNGIKPGVLEHLDIIAKFTGCDIFLLSARPADPDNLSANYHINGSDQTLDQRLRIAIYGDPESSEHAKMRVLIMIDQILKRIVDVLKLELSLHHVICGRTRKNVRLIESATNTAIYFPPPFPGIYGYIPPGAHKRGEDEIYITGDSQENINQAKKKLHEVVMNTKCYAKEVMVSANKIDSILLDRLGKVRKVMELNGSYVIFPPLGSQRGVVRVQGTEILHVERTIKEIMALAGQFYSATWWIIQPDPAQANSRPPSPADIRAMLSDICTNSGAELSFEKFSFAINGSDDAVKAAMVVINQIPFINRAQYSMRVKIELANEHKEFVSGKKNGKINKIMGQSNVQIIFDGFNEYNFYIDVCGSQYEATKNGLDLVEQEMPASISFHVPDQYHKRIIGIGGQHIQRIMKKYSVFVKFSNAMDRGGIGKEDDDIKVDNVICRTPARNAQSLDLVKQEIMDMVEKVDAEFVSETVIINRLYHRELVARMSKIEELEKKWNCKIDFPPTEMASDVVTISGPEYQVPQALDEFLGMVPENHELVLPGTAGLREYFKSEDFETEVRQKLKSQYEVILTVREDAPPLDEESGTTEECLLLSYTRNNAGGLKDAIDFMVSRLVLYGLDASNVKGTIPRPKSDTFEEALPFFHTKLLHHAPPPLLSDSPTRQSFVDNGEGSDRTSLFDKLRKPGSISSISSLLDRRKNNSSSSNSLYKYASNNASRASLVSMESRDSGYRNPWNDSGVNLSDIDDAHSIHSTHNNGSNGGWPIRFDSTGSGNGGNKTFSSPFSTTTTSPFSNSMNSSFTTSGMVSTPGDSTPKHEPRPSFDSGRPATSHSFNGYPAPIGPPR